MGELQNNDAIQLFEDKKIRTAWDEEQEEWYFSIVDVIAVLTGTENPRRYWSDLKRKLKKEGAVELYEKIVQLKMLSSDGKKYKTDVANTEKKVPREWINEAGNGVNHQFVEYALPLIQGEPDLPKVDSLPRFAHLKKILAK